MPLRIDSFTTKQDGQNSGLGSSPGPVDCEASNDIFPVDMDALLGGTADEEDAGMEDTELK